MFDPRQLRKTLVLIIKILIVVELVGAFSMGVGQGQWGRFGFDLLVAGLLYMMWDRIRLAVRDKKEEYRRKMETSSHQTRLWDAFVFSLLWSDEIYQVVPADRRRLIVISYTLIALGVLAAFIQIGSGLMPLVIAGALVLAAVNLLVWVVSLERGEKESLETELKLAHDVQTSLMPAGPPDIPGFEIAGISIPARQVGGDHFDYSCMNGDPRRFGVSVCDVSGKGMEAAMTAVFTSGAFKSYTTDSRSPAEILSRLNRSVYAHTRRGQFVAFLLAVLDGTEKTVTFANAGQTKPLLKSGGTAEWMDSVGVHFPLGMIENVRYEERTLSLRKGDVLLLLTDGITEAMNAGKELYGDERFVTFVCSQQTDTATAEELVRMIGAEVRSFLGAAPQNDDMSVVVIKVVA